MTLNGFEQSQETWLWVWSWSQLWDGSYQQRVLLVPLSTLLCSTLQLNILDSTECRTVWAAASNSTTLLGGTSPTETFPPPVVLYWKKTLNVPLPWSTIFPAMSRLRLVDFTLHWKSPQPNIFLTFPLFSVTRFLDCWADRFGAQSQSSCSGHGWSLSDRRAWSASRTSGLDMGNGSESGHGYFTVLLGLSICRDLAVRGIFPLAYLTWDNEMRQQCSFTHKNRQWKKKTPYQKDKISLTSLEMIWQQICHTRELL